MMYVCTTTTIIVHPSFTTYLYLYIIQVLMAHLVSVVLQQDSTPSKLKLFRYNKGGSHRTPLSGQYAFQQMPMTALSTLSTVEWRSWEMMLLSRLVVQAHLQDLPVAQNGEERTKCSSPVSRPLCNVSLDMQKMGVWNVYIISRFH